MSPQEVRDTANSRTKQRLNEIYTLSGMIRVAVLSVFNEKVRFPDNPIKEESVGDWRNSKAYFKALQKIHKGGAK